MFLEDFLGDRMPLNGMFSEMLCKKMCLLTSEDKGGTLWKIHENQGFWTIFMLLKVSEATSEHFEHSCAKNSPILIKTLKKSKNLSFWDGEF